METIGRPPVYIAYLLRCWLDGTSWRYSLEEVGSKKRRGFATLDELVAFLVAISNFKDEGPKKTKVTGISQEIKSSAFIDAKTSSNDER